MKKPQWNYVIVDTGDCCVRLARWQTEPFTEKVLRQLHQQPKVIIDRQSVIRHTHADHNVPDISDIASYVECTSVSTQELHASPSPRYDDDNIENELTRMFNSEHDKLTDIHETAKGDVSKVNRKQKRRQTVKDLLIDLFGSSLDDLGEPTPPKKIRTRRRHTLPVSLRVDPETLIPLRRKSEEGTATCPKKQPAIVTAVIRTVDVSYSRVCCLVVPPVYAETARVSRCDCEMEKAYTTGNPCVSWGPDVNATKKVNEVIDLTADDDNTVLGFNGIQLGVKGEFLQSGDACAPSMPLLSPMSPGEPTRAEEVLPTQRPPPVGRHLSLEIFPVGSASGGCQASEAGTRDNTQDVTGLKASMGNVQPKAYVMAGPRVVSPSVGNQQPNVVGPRIVSPSVGSQQPYKLGGQIPSVGKNLRPNTYVEHQAQNSPPPNVCIGNQQNRTRPGGLIPSAGNFQPNTCLESLVPNSDAQKMPEPRGVSVGNPISNVSRPMGVAIANQQNVCGPASNHNGKTVAQVAPLKEKTKGRKRTNVDTKTMEAPQGRTRRKRSTERPILPTPPQDRFHIALNGGGMVSVQQQQNAPQNPEVMRMNHSILDDLVQWEAAKKRTMLTNQACPPPAYPGNRPNFQVPGQWQWPAVNNPQMTPRPSPELNQLPPRLVRLLSVPEYAVISNSVCAEKLYPHVNKFIQWRAEAFQFYDKTKKYFLPSDVKDHVSKFMTYSQQVRLLFSRNMVKELSGIDVQDFNMHQILTYLAVRVVENGCRVTIYRICSSMFTMLIPVEAQCTTPFLKRLFANVKACVEKMEEKSKQVPLFTMAQLQLLETQIRQYTVIQNWLTTKMGSVPLRVRIPEMKKAQQRFNAQRWQSSSSEIPQQIQETVSRLQQENTLQSAKTVPQGTNASTSESTNPRPAQSVAEKTTAQTQETTANAQRNTVESGTFECTDNRITVESVSLPAPPTTQESAGVQTAANVDVPENPKVVVEESVQESQQCNKDQTEATTKDQTEVTTDVAAGVKSEAKKNQVEHVIDLTWIEDGDQEEILEEIIECKFFPFKVENYEESEEGTTREVVSPTDSGLGSPVAQSDGDGFKCLCGNRATYICACNSSMYCSTDCQNRDWVYHQKLCHKMKS